MIIADEINVILMNRIICNNLHCEIVKNMTLNQNKTKIIHIIMILTLNKFYGVSAICQKIYLLMQQITMKQELQLLIMEN